MLLTCRPNFANVAQNTLNAGQAWCNEWQTSVVRKKEMVLRDEEVDDESNKKKETILK
jgi:hypothetical protein